jgi:TolB-like protein
MKKYLILWAALALLSLPVSAEKTYKITDGVAAVARGLTAKLPEGTKVVVLDIKSGTPDAGEYVADELTYDLLQSERLIVVDRESLDQIRQELALQTSGDVSDESAQRLGALLGAETIVTGTFDLVGNKYRLTVKAVKVETAQIQYLDKRLITADAETTALFGTKTGAAKAVESTGKAVRTVGDFIGRAFCSSINPMFGIGSFIQGDGQGGGTVVFWEAVGTGSLIMAGNSGSSGWAALGAVSLGGGIVYSWIRPWTYNRHPEVARALDNVSVGLAPDRSMSLGYRVRY